MAAPDFWAQYWARYERMLHVCGPQSWRHLLASSADVEAASSVCKQAAAGAPTAPGALVEAQRLLAATLHPDTLQPIPLPFRMSAHVPVNTVLLLGMCTAVSPLATAVWQGLNQTFNAAQFYANRNATNQVTDAQLLASFAGATMSAVGYVG